MLINYLKFIYFGTIIIGVILIVISLIYSLIINEKSYLTDCYDRNGNKIIGLICEESLLEDDDLIIIGTLFVMGVISLFGGVVIKDERIKEKS